MQNQNNEYPHAYVGFMGYKRKHWPDYLNPKGFFHCFPFWYDADVGLWIVSETYLGGISIKTMTPEKFDKWLIILQKAGAKILQVDKKPSPHFFFRLGLWCVPYTAHAVGSKSRAWRPITLWRNLLRDGAIPAFFTKEAFKDESQSNGNRKPRG